MLRRLNLAGRYREWRLKRRFGKGWSREELQAWNKTQQHLQEMGQLKGPVEQLLGFIKNPETLPGLPQSIKPESTEAKLYGYIKMIIGGEAPKSPTQIEKFRKWVKDNKKDPVIIRELTVLRNLCSLAGEVAASRLHLDVEGRDFHPGTEKRLFTLSAERKAPLRWIFGSRISYLPKKREVQGRERQEMARKIAQFEKLNRRRLFGEAGEEGNFGLLRDKYGPRLEQITSAQVVDIARPQIPEREREVA
jgi:hypothetical protein